MKNVSAILSLTVFMAASVTLSQRRNEKPTPQNKTTPSENEANTEAVKAWANTS
jgi:hypothetical protein